MALATSPIAQNADLAAALEVLKRDYTKLGARIRQLQHTTTCECAGVKIRLHFPSISQGKATVSELVDVIIHYLTWFTLPRSQIDSVLAQYGTISAEDFQLKVSQLFQSAVSLFKRANKATNRNGEAGEFILFLLTEWILAAPQLLAKMSLKTNAAMPVHGADGIHVGYSKEDSQLIVFWGESKLYTSVSDAISAAITSIKEANQPEKQRHELELVARNLGLSGLEEAAQEAILRHLDPFDEAYNNKKYVTTCLIGFNCDAYGKVSEADGQEAEAKFQKYVSDQLSVLSGDVAKKLDAAGLANQQIELFFFPVPSIADLRDRFQSKIGWSE